MELKYFFYVPKALRLLMFAILGSGFALSMWTLFLFLRGGMGVDYVVVALSVLQGVSTLIFIMILAIYSEKGSSIERLNRASKHFLTEELTNALKKKVWLFEGGATFFATVELETRKGSLALPEEIVSWYTVIVANYMLVLHVWFNLRNLLVIYYLPQRNEIDQNGIPVGLESTLSGFASKYYTIRAEREILEHSGQEAIALYLYLSLDEDLIENANTRLFWTNDICNMTRSIFRQAQLGRIELWPSPIS